MRIAIVNLKGGVGKTTTAVHLAAALAVRGRTLLIDSDPHRSALSWSERAADGWPYAVVALPVRDVHRRVVELAAGYDHVVIDSPPNDQAIARSVVLAADTVVVPLSPSTMDVDRLRDTLELVAELEPSHELTLHVLLVAVQARTRLAADLAILLDEMGAPRLEARVMRRQAYAAAFGGMPDPRLDYDQVLQEIAP